MGDALQTGARRVLFSGKATLLATTLCAGLAMPAQAFDIQLTTSNGDEALQERLLAATLTSAAKEEGSIDPQDIIAAAQSDYRRLVSTLYSLGHFSPNVSIRVDGQEAHNH